MDISSISLAISALKNASDLAKMLKDAGSTFERAEFKLKLADLMEHLADSKINLADVRLILEQKDKEISELREKLSVKEDLSYDPPYYWSYVAGIREGPFCPNCYDTSKNLIRLQNKGPGSWNCHNCKIHVKDSSFVPPQPFKSNPRPRRLLPGY